MVKRFTSRLQQTF